MAVTDLERARREEAVAVFLGRRRGLPGQESGHGNEGVEPLRKEGVTGLGGWVRSMKERRACGQWQTSACACHSMAGMPTGSGRPCGDGCKFQTAGVELEIPVG